MNFKLNNSKETKIYKRMNYQFKNMLLSISYYYYYYYYICEKNKIKKDLN
jgi:hypothetical protein